MTHAEEKQAEEKHEKEKEGGSNRRGLFVVGAVLLIIAILAFAVIRLTNWSPSNAVTNVQSDDPDLPSLFRSQTEIAATTPISGTAIAVTIVPGASTAQQTPMTIVDDSGECRMYKPWVTCLQGPRSVRSGELVTYIFKPGQGVSECKVEGLTSLTQKIYPIFGNSVSFTYTFTADTTFWVMCRYGDRGYSSGSHETVNVKIR